MGAGCVGDAKADPWQDDVTKELKLVALDESRAARKRIFGVATDSPLVRLNVDDAPPGI
jgi:hypothetical protein